MFTKIVKKIFATIILNSYVLHFIKRTKFNQVTIIIITFILLIAVLLYVLCLLELTQFEIFKDLGQLVTLNLFWSHKSSIFLLD
jgi:hypothetical protein